MIQKEQCLAKVEQIKWKDVTDTDRWKWSEMEMESGERRDSECEA